MSAPSSTPSAPRSAGPRHLLPGLALAALIAAAAFGLKSLGIPGLERLSPLMLAIVLGMLVRNTLGRPEYTRAGLAASLRAPLRLGIVLLGLQVTLAEILGIGWAGLSILAFALIGTVMFTIWLGARLGVPPGLTTLIAAGTGVCGASAIVAANTVVRDSDESVAYALATVTLLGTIALFSYPVIATVLPLSEVGYGLWTGASVHEVAQVVAAGFALGQQTGEFATVTKLARVLMLAPLIIALGVWWSHRTALAGDGVTRSARPPLPWFVFGFLGMVLLAGTGWIDPSLRVIANTATQALLAFALAAVGLETDFRKLVSQGWRPLALGALSTLFIAITSLLLALVWQNA